jgi:hypothetical protein
VVLHDFTRSDSVTAVVKTAMGAGSDLAGAKSKVDGAVQMYTTATTSLGVTLGVQNLVNQQEEKRNQREEEIREWIWMGNIDSEERHKVLTETRIPKSGQWFLKSDEFNNWTQIPDGSSTLICSGKGRSQL